MYNVVGTVDGVPIIWRSFVERFHCIVLWRVFYLVESIERGEAESISESVEPLGGDTPGKEVGLTNQILGHVESNVSV